MTKSELKKELDKLGVTYPKRATKAKLEELLNYTKDSTPRTTVTSIIPESLEKAVNAPLKPQPKPIPPDLWQEAPRNGIYKLYPGKSVTIPNIGEVTNETGSVIRLVSGQELPSNLR